jgi:hypothetical protein
VLHAVRECVADDRDVVACLKLELCILRLRGGKDGNGGGKEGAKWNGHTGLKVRGESIWGVDLREAFLPRQRHEGITRHEFRVP